MFCIKPFIIETSDTVQLSKGELPNELNIFLNQTNIFFYYQADNFERLRIFIFLV